jgi:hypothetical protein
MDIKLKNWQKRFQQFLLDHENKIINLYGYPSGKSFMALYDKNNKDRIYYHYESLSDLQSIHDHINDGFTVIIISIDKIKKDNFIYFEVMDTDD